MGLKFSVENYRAFAESAEIDIRPLTLLFGYNSAGKSALLRWLPFLRDSLSGDSAPLNMTAPAVRGATFSDILSKFTSSPALRFAFTKGNKRLEYVVRDLPDQRRQIVEVCQVGVGSDVVRLEWLADEARPDAYTRTQGKSSDVVQIRFSGLHPCNEEHADIASIGMGVIGSRLLHEWLSSTYWLQANRSVPPRKEVFTGVLSPMLPDGSGITQLLYSEDAAGSDIVTALSDWYQEATGFKLQVRRGAFGTAELFSFCLETAGQQIELADTGEGMGQVLPILGLLLLAERGRLGERPTLVFEHPELHLHSAAEPALANLLCRVASTSTAKIIAETHSESFLLALQLALLEGRLKPEDVIVYWVRQSEGSPASVNEITFDTGGRPQGGAWPPGVFDEKAEQARRVVLARRAQKADAS
jgi:predicted ATPase